MMSEDLYTQRISALLARLPERLRKGIQWLLEPSRKWVRIPSGLLFCVGGLLGFLPVLGFWMLPVGILLLSEDFPPFRRLSMRGLDWVARKRPGWLEPPAGSPPPGNPPDASSGGPA
ncbi:hypothetical protein LOC54_00075 [Acetobacter sp. AN02]|uniref:hypothetical protein n=1 Tax=Acetobacter sp. AN02 TaxID=2894186 RepID=UPI0024341D55|nr:hypothetical protein [Acetobacter sp. AN02]MDG6093522.1 hypothetical protein [Acetobacter sp. AN02]